MNRKGIVWGVVLLSALEFACATFGTKGSKELEDICQLPVKITKDLSKESKELGCSGSSCYNIVAGKIKLQMFNYDKRNFSEEWRKLNPDYIMLDILTGGVLVQNKKSGIYYLLTYRKGASDGPVKEIDFYFCGLPFGTRRVIGNIEVDVRKKGKEGIGYASKSAPFPNAPVCK